MELRYKNGSIGVIKGLDGKDGITPHIGENGHWYLGDTDTGVSAKGSKGEPGQAFAIVKTYPTIAEMDADHGNEEVLVGQFVMIDTNDVDDPDNARLYLKTETGFNYITDLSGATGLTGPSGKSAYQIAVDNGFEGTEEEWLESLTGPSGAAPTIPLTSAEYDALSEEEKQSNTVWLLTDKGASESSDDTSSGGSSGITYTEGETVIGTWIDGKPLYRNVITGTTPTTLNAWIGLGSKMIYPDTLVSVYGSIKMDNSDFHPLNSLHDECVVNATIVNNSPSVLVNDSLYANRTVTLILEYTKRIG